MKWKFLIVVAGLAALNLIWLPAFSQTADSTVSSQESLHEQREHILSMIDEACGISHEWLGAHEGVYKLHMAYLAAADSAGGIDKVDLTLASWLINSCLAQLPVTEDLAMQLYNKSADIESAFTSLVDNHYSTSEEYNSASANLSEALETFRAAPHHTYVETASNSLRDYLKAVQTYHQAWKYYSSNYTKYRSLWTQAGHWLSLGNSLNSDANGLLDEIDKANEALRAALIRVRKLLCRPTVLLVFLHGLLSDGRAMNPLRANLEKELSKPDIGIEVIGSLQESYPNTVSLDQWATNIAQSIVQWDLRQQNPDAPIVIIGHSMGGKAAVYAIAHIPALVQIAGQIGLICTINTPYRPLDQYDFNSSGVEEVLAPSNSEGYPELDLEHACSILCSLRLKLDKGVCYDLAHTDIANEAVVVTKARKIPIYAFVSGEETPASDTCNGVLRKMFMLEQLLPDVYLNDRDDGIVPITAQSAPGVTEKIEYGTFCHGEYGSNPDVALQLAIRISAILKKKLSTTKCGKCDFFL